MNPAILRRAVPLACAVVCVGVAVPTDSRAGVDVVNTQSDAVSRSCSVIEGKWAFWGELRDGVRATPATFLQMLYGPSRRGVARVELTQRQHATQERVIQISFVDNDGQRVGNDIVVLGRCEADAFRAESQLAGSADGSQVEAVRLWIYRVNQTEGATVLSVDYASTGKKYFLPFIGSPFTSSGRYVFQAVP